jgi:hypothetical protein
MTTVPMIVETAQPVSAKTDNPVAVIDELFTHFTDADLQQQLYLSSLKKFLLRICEAWAKGQIDNASLYAGSPMYYYCRHCGLLACTMSEGHWGRPSRVCDDCADMKEWLKDGIA